MSAEEIYRAALAGQRRLAEAWRARADEEELARLAAALRGDLERLASRVGATEKEATAASEAGAGSGRVEPSDPVTPSRQPPSEAEIEAMERATAELRTVLPPPETGAGTADEPSLAAVSRDRIGRACGEAIERLDRLEALWRRPQPDRRQIEAALAELERALDAVARPPGTDDAEPLPDG